MKIINEKIKKCDQGYYWSLTIDSLKLFQKENILLGNLLYDTENECQSKLEEFKKDLCIALLRH